MQHLLDKVGCTTMLVSKRTRLVLDGQIEERIFLQSAEPYTVFLDEPTNGLMKLGEDTIRGPASATTNPLILHSSGTTGFPKPITLSPRYPLLYAACHEFPDEQKVEWTNLSTLPLYHGFGLLAPCLSLSVGMKCCFPPSSTIPAGQSTLSLLEQFDCRSLMTVPSIIDDLLAMGNLPFTRLRKLEFLAVGGGALTPDQGARLHSGHVRLINHYGVTELGALAPIFLPREDYDYRYLRLRSDLGLELRPTAPGSSRFRLIGWPLDSDQPFEIQDDIETNLGASPGHVEVRILGRIDDVIVLKTGEKVLPQQLESVLNAHASIKTAVCLGQGQFEVVVLVEPIDDLFHGETMVDMVWNVISEANTKLDRHAQVTSRAAIIIKPQNKTIPRTDKGSISRKLSHEVFADEMRAAYSALEMESPGVTLDAENITPGIRDMIRRVFPLYKSVGSDIEDDHDLFELGMDSLQALRLARLLSSAITQHRPDWRHGKGAPSAELVYRCPSVAKLSTAIHGVLQVQAVEEPVLNGTKDRGSPMRTLVHRLTSSLKPTTQMTTSHVVLLTGATGGLGSHVLAELVKRTDVKKVICLSRTPILTDPSHAAMEDKLRARLQASLSASGISSLNEVEWEKIDTAVDSDLRRGSPLFSHLASQITHIIHLAWPMDFHRTLDSFGAHIKMLTTLIELARHSQPQNPSGRRVRLIFASSIAVVRHFQGGGRMVPESIMDEPYTAAPMGYAEAKWVCEHIMSYASDVLRQEIEPVVVRIGQLSGPEHTDGIWKTVEHIPVLVKASQRIGAFPLLNGVSLSFHLVRKAQRDLLTKPSRQFHGFRWTDRRVL